MADIRILAQVARREGREPIQMPVVISVEEAALMLRVGRVTVYLLIRRKLLKSVKIRNCRRVVLSSVYEYIQRLSGDDDDAA
jgi:excisionase family DNA binding protein